MGLDFMLHIDIIDILENLHICGELSEFCFSATLVESNSKFSTFFWWKKTDPFACFLVEKKSFTNGKLRVSLIKVYCVGFFSIKKRKVQPSPFCTWYTTSHYQFQTKKPPSREPMFKVFRSTSTSPLFPVIRCHHCANTPRHMFAFGSAKISEVTSQRSPKTGGVGFPASVLGGRNLWQSCMIPGPTTTREESKWIWNDKNLYCVYMYLTMIQYMLTGFFPNIKVLWWCLPDAQSYLPKVETIG